MMELSVSRIWAGAIKNEVATLRGSFQVGRVPDLLRGMLPLAEIGAPFTPVRRAIPRLPQAGILVRHLLRPSPDDEIEMRLEVQL